MSDKHESDNGSGVPGGDAKAKGGSRTPAPTPRATAHSSGRGGTAPAGERRLAGGRRHLGRILALQILYETDVTDHPSRDVLGRTFEAQDLLDDDELPAAAESEKVREHVERLVGGVQGLRDVIDPHIAAAAPAFPVEQLPTIDRNVLRLAIYELLRETDVPVKAAINEAVELAKRFGGDNSGRFVNGVLGTVAERIGAEGRRNGGGEGARGQGGKEKRRGAGAKERGGKSEGRTDSRASQ